MGLFSKEFIPAGGIDLRVQEKIPGFLNAAPTAEAIAGIEPRTGPILDNPRRGYSEGRPGYDIGLTVAHRIIQAKGRLGGAFTYLNQVTDVEGFGADKLGDMAYTFGPSHTRKHALTLTDAEWDAFKNAVQELIDSGEYQRHVSIHADMGHDMHHRIFMDGEVMFSQTGLHRLLPWHCTDLGYTYGIWPIKISRKILEKM